VVTFFQGEPLPNFVIVFQRRKQNNYLYFKIPKGLDVNSRGWNPRQRLYSCATLKRVECEYAPAKMPDKELHHKAMIYNEINIYFHMLSSANNFMFNPCGVA